MSWEMAQRITGGCRYYSIFEGGEISPGYQIGALELWEFGNPSSSQQFAGAYHYVWSGKFTPRDETRYEPLGHFYNHDTLDDIFELLFQKLIAQQPSAGPFHAVRCSHGAPG